ncbi:unclassified [Brachyspira pilosicoli WesB]|uniref:Unclassified n=1 Tax=Brachyspira pilosicoli WesB TaxID=1161918 RepID=K0JMZ0_BRAPL|nr:hypothetical protein [Brachyspira pilosicoli]PLV55286.1 hypothetical protein BPSP16_11805 [Brachyspira pilosicoli SP16]CCG58025.1 unclassified [Brachyspira pilosicoli WesB]
MYNNAAKNNNYDNNYRKDSYTVYIKLTEEENNLLRKCAKEKDINIGLYAKNIIFNYIRTEINKNNQ